MSAAPPRSRSGGAMIILGCRRTKTPISDPERIPLLVQPRMDSRCSGRCCHRFPPPSLVLGQATSEFFMADSCHRSIHSENRQGPTLRFVEGWRAESQDGLCGVGQTVARHVSKRLVGRSARRIASNHLVLQEPHVHQVLKVRGKAAPGLSSIPVERVVHAV